MKGEMFTRTTWKGANWAGRRSSSEDGSQNVH